MIDRYVPVSIGEHIDKITILEIKAERITDSEKLNNVRKELELLLTLDREGIVGTEEYYKLHEVNQSLWNVEDEIRVKDRENNFGVRFVELAREVYRLNDERSRIKKDINIKYGSDLIEEKSYEQ
jgi:hypothetical protein